MSCSKHVAKLLIGMVLAISLVPATPAFASERAVVQPEFAAEAVAAGLNAQQANWLQSEVDRYLSRMGGKQTAANRIVIDNAIEVSVALPGEQYPRYFSTSAVDARTLAAGPCTGGTAYGHFCAYQGRNGTGTQIDMYQCARYNLPGWTAHGSWGNNQTRGTSARFFDQVDIIYNTLPAPSNSQDEDWNPVYSIRNCG